MGAFKNYVNESVTTGAAFEEVIIAAWNGKRGPKIKNIAPDAGDKIVKYLKSQNITGESASKLALKGVEVTSEWSKFWLPEKVPPTTKTPKTDILIGTNRISLKMGAAQLMSGGVNESKATFYAATRSMEKSDLNVTSELFKEISSKIDTLTKIAFAKGKIEGEIQKGKDKFLTQANKVNNDVKSLMQKAFTDSVEFRRAFIREAITGEVKFGPQAPAYAEYVLSSDPDGNTPHLYQSTNEKFLDKVVNKTGVTVRFKSGSVKSKSVKTGVYRYWSVVALGVKKLEEELNYYNGILLTENMVISMIERIKKYILELFQKAYEYLRGGIKNIVEFFDLQPEINFDNTVDFNKI